MNNDLSLNHNQSVKLVDFFPFEWSSNLLAVCLKDSIKIYLYEEESSLKSKLRPIISLPSNNRINHFTWSPKTNIATMDPLINFASCDSENTLTFFKIPLEVNLTTKPSKDNDQISKKLLPNFDHVYKVAFDCNRGENLAYTADNYCFLWDNVQSILRAKFLLQSPGINICWHRDEINKLMIVEKSGLIRVYNLSTLQPVFTLLPITTRINSLPLIGADWCQLNPAVVIANTSADIFIWNTAYSCLPDRIHEESDSLKYLKLASYKENLLGFVSGNDINSKLKIVNYKTNEIIYEKRDIKLFKSFSFCSTLPLIAIASENKLLITKLN